MRPDRDEMLAIVRRALIEFVAPEVTTVYGRTELTYALNLISQIAREADNAVPDLVAENASLRKLLRAAGRRLQASDHADLADHLAAVAKPVSRPDLRLSSLRQENARLFEALIGLQTACESAPDGDAAARAAYEMTLAFLMARADRQAGPNRR